MRWTSHAGSTYAILIPRERHWGSAHSRDRAGASERFEVAGHNSELWLRKLSWRPKWCVWSLIRCLQNTTSWTPTLPDRISQGWKIIASENYVIFRHHDHENYVARVIKQECPRAWWRRAWLVGVFCVILSNLKHKNLQQMLLAKLSICHIWTSQLVPAHNHGKLIMFRPSLRPSLYGISRHLHIFASSASMTDAFPSIFVQTEMNSEVEQNQISVDTATLTQDVSTSPIGLLLFIGFHKTGWHVMIDSRALCSNQSVHYSENTPGYRSGPCSRLHLMKVEGLSMFLPRRWAPIYELLTWMKQGFKTE